MHRLLILGLKNAFLRPKFKSLCIKVPARRKMPAHPTHTKSSLHSKPGRPQTLNNSPYATAIPLYELFLTEQQQAAKRNDDY